MKRPSEERPGAWIVSGDELRVGDVIDVWWQPNRDQITALREYNGPHKPLGCIAIADFALNRTGMTIWDCENYTVLTRGPEHV
jgi:hypothetical protein